jgi:hypothetical protein
MESQLLISFTDQSPSFTYGVEFGRLLHKMEQGDEVVCNNGLPVRYENKDLLIRTCSVLGYIPVFCREYNGGWLEFMAIKKDSCQN